MNTSSIHAFIRILSSVPHELACALWRLAAGPLVDPVVNGVHGLNERFVHLKVYGVEVGVVHWPGQQVGDHLLAVVLVDEARGGELGVGKAAAEHVVEAALMVVEAARLRIISSANCGEIC
jgi:hypothetical protein